jgi:hypothetical protein
MHRTAHGAQHLRIDPTGISLIQPSLNVCDSVLHSTTKNQGDTVNLATYHRPSFPMMNLCYFSQVRIEKLVPSIDMADTSPT